MTVSPTDNQGDDVTVDGDVSRLQRPVHSHLLAVALICQEEAMAQTMGMRT